ncbi:response regulator transcription factor [Variovorax paradoxus]|jgi:DNA-binding response OmpR family regulator|uniref:response regulator transcription factor n=1 Tax=Variovorax paradoxus TaxID=34073 RepID=UPI00035E6023|nr:response regulator transcription factor [Variovorax paradoxus]
MRIVALDDQAEGLDLIKETLNAVGHECHVFTNGASLKRELQRGTIDLAIVGWQLPDITGPEMVRWARSNLKDRIPILFVGNCHQERDIVEGLASGADDFMAKPIRAGELTARVQALLRRAYAESPTAPQTWGRYRFVPLSGQLEINGRSVGLTRKEFDLSLILFRNIGRLLTRQYLLETIWRTNNPVGMDLMSRSLDTHISRLRSILELGPGAGYRLIAVYGQGYRMDAIDVGIVS